MTRRLILTLLLTAVLPAVGLATPREREYRLHPKDVAASPSYVQRVEPAIVAVRVRSDPNAASSARLGSRRFATGFIVSPSSPAWGGSAVVNAAGEVIGVASLRLGDPPHVNLAIPIEKFTPVKDELIATGRVMSRRPRPWLGLYTAAIKGGVVVDDFAPAGPARTAGFRKGDRIVSVNGVTVVSQEEFYEQLWRGQAGDVVQVAVQRGGGVHVISVRSMDRYLLLRPLTP